MATFKGNPITLQGTAVQVGQTAPDFQVLANDLSPVTRDTYQGVRIISVVPSIDTGVCDAQTRKFNEEAATIEGVTVMTVSNDLPFAQRRWCASSGLDQVVTLSDHRDLSFGTQYGVAIEELRLLARSVFVLDSNNEITYVEYLEESTDEVNFEAALAAAREAK
ncbi:peroxidase [Exiguobacterium sp. Leaf187]|uniref:Thiol peroxidase n=2 Tax=Exiguobacterium indicum TaxID=296995 RepID=A0A0V8GJ62_9BACL|nr:MULTISPECIES: thiol peroxidase [Exiguobacterium]KNH32766.1 peroxidase [Exiguobacterium acetylicum]KQS19671.1 peroxidase [Exiguobacterium sp. Leaf187]KSU50318.1 peroxidase [Exiguobacterium enclense]KTR25956.1 peroxidase [Exiguobacterium indicum]KTR61598.1 peroxidase [Exiguobacterium indicum]